MAEGLTPADVMALNNNDGFGNGAWFWIILILFFCNGNWGNNNDVARESSMNTQFIERDLAGINTNVLNNRYDLGTQILENRYANQLAECETQKDILLGNANLQKDILLGNQTMQSQMAQCCLKNYKKIKKFVDNHIRNNMLCTA